ncbi:hypothetical protein PAXRUDRAFT_829688 [Paxillus rubicundulus Ve08.2h10]|uniref:Uncharacterized protein n=1 Tax=Paxillus rubicundulus Ve08.2h10 TaxID=930991 RepID=A0A0D0D742_9AGAM|nr:hypothetical protein PAXRUDRAFT_829688 [Paxillus rubicundulus Ve08.2h10]
MIDGNTHGVMGGDDTRGTRITNVWLVAAQQRQEGRGRDGLLLIRAVEIYSCTWYNSFVNIPTKLLRVQTFIRIVKLTAVHATLQMCDTLVADSSNSSGWRIVCGMAPS